MGKKKILAFENKITPDKINKKEIKRIEIIKKKEIKEKIKKSTYVDVNDVDGRYIYIYEIGSRRILVMDP